MYSTYTSSAIAFRSKGSIPFSSNDGCYYLLNERVNKSASNSSCACCTFCFHGVPINPRFLYGLRQSTLLHYSASRMLILGAGHRNYRFLVSDFNRSCCGDGYFIKESVGTSRRRRRGRCMAWEEKKCDLGVDGTAEAMLGLLAEQVDEKVLGVRERNGRLVSEKARVEGRRRGREEKKNLELDSLEMNSEIKFESVTNVLREEGHRRLGGKEVSSGHESSKLRKEGSSCSSYYSVLSSDDIDESDVDIQDKDGEFIGGSSSRHQNKEMRSGEVVFEGNVRKKFEKYEDHAAEYWESLTHENDEEEYSMAIGVAQDVRNRGGKQYTEDSVGEKESRKEFLLKPSNTMDSHESVAERASASRKQVRSREKNSTLSTPLVEKIGQKHSQSGVQVIQQSVSRRKSQQITETPEIQESDIGTSSSSQLRFSGREENLSATGTVVQEAREKHNRKGNLIIRENRRRPSLNSQSETKTLVHDIDLERTSPSQRTSVSRLNNTVDNSAMLLTSAHDSREQRTLTDQKFVGKTETREESQDLTNISVSHSTDTKTVADSKGVLETRMTSRKEKSTSIVDLAQEARGHQATERVIRRVGSRNSQRPTTERDSSSRTPFNYLGQARQQHVAAQSEDGRNSQVMVMPPPSQFVARTSHETIGYQKSTSGHARENVSFETSGSGSITLQAEDEEPDFPHELDGQTIYGDHLESTLHNDALDSATRLEESSNQFVGEFAEKLQHEVMTSGLVEEKTSSLKSVVYKNGKYSQHSSSQQVSEDLRSQVHFPGQSSAVSGTKGPSDEMWDVAGPVPQEPSEEHGEVSPTSGIAVVKRSNRSLWSFIADIVRMRWHTRSDTHGLTVKSVGKNSSNESFTSDAWFSSHEPDDKIDENVKKGRRGMKKEDRPDDQFHLGEASSQSQGKATTGTYSQIESDMSSPLGTVESSSPFEGGASLASQDEHFGDKQEVMRSEGLHSTIITADSSLPVHSRHLIRSPPVKEDTSQSSTAKVSLASKDFGGKQAVIRSDGLHSTIITTDPSLPLHSRRLIRSPPVKEEISESSKAKVSSTNFTEVAEQPILDRLKDDSGAESKDGELKRRKLQRNKQVLTETFEEWEEAYRLESEQRKIDERFMREALLEARKAADTWEVPVGAVLVQHGKIIARGCNLVEELRDSTAHAEMICIRQASNVLRSWRLADTTLYVTLEPCAMCAGAILQARIDSVVWGAPNKLLGADGSWVRLFPGGPEGASDLTNQLHGPVHPFHPKMAIRRGILANECAEVMQQFFQLRRKKRVASPPPSGLPVSTHPSKLFSKIHDIFSIMFCL